MYEQLIYAVLAATSYAFLFFFKKEPRPPFNKEQILLTVVLGVIIGLVQFYTGLQFDLVMGYLFSFGMVAIFESIIKLVWRRLPT